MAEHYSIEDVIGDLYGDNGLTHENFTALLAELAELRRKAAVYDRLHPVATAAQALCDHAAAEPEDDVTDWEVWNEGKENAEQALWDALMVLRGEVAQ